MMKESKARKSPDTVPVYMYLVYETVWKLESWTDSDSGSALSSFLSKNIFTWKQFSNKWNDMLCRSGEWGASTLLLSRLVMQIYELWDRVLQRNYKYILVRQNLCNVLYREIGISRWSFWTMPLFSYSFYSPEIWGPVCMNEYLLYWMQ